VIFKTCSRMLELSILAIISSRKIVPRNSQNEKPVLSWPCKNPSWHRGEEGIGREEGGGEPGRSRFAQGGGFHAGGADLGPQRVQPRDDALLFGQRRERQPEVEEGGLVEGVSPCSLAFRAARLVLHCSIPIFMSGRSEISPAPSNPRGGRGFGA